ncbi:class I SAM-dependent methyltransferase [uncultured Anaerococcus sp.]|uniref:tRNA (adenine(22)-N(1))-methyltransferase n=2 Tax=uncultured Anaerococcus sp. TaxID=293428 RepID=UPI0028897037|nr:class I SAM-dependent methyltransferase [uncultured Anaerococcus sp.]
MDDKKRLLDIINLIDENKNIIDIGTDHGLVPLYLAKNGISKNILATDISEKSLEKLRTALTDELSTIISTRVTDGFKGIEKKENQVAIIAGMGANTIIDIIEDSLDFAENLDYLILASNINTEKLRIYLNDRNFRIINDFLSFENGKYYDIIKACYGKTSKLTLAETYYGKDDIKNKSRLLEEKLQEDYNKNQAFRKAIIENAKDNRGLDRIDERLEAIDEVRKLWKLEN